MKLSMNTPVGTKVKMYDEDDMDWKEGKVTDETSVSKLVKWGTDEIPTEIYPHQFDKVKIVRE